MRFHVTYKCSNGTKEWTSYNVVEALDEDHAKVLAKQEARNIVEFLTIKEMPYL